MEILRIERLRESGTLVRSPHAVLGSGIRAAYTEIAMLNRNTEDSLWLELSASPFFC